MPKTQKGVPWKGWSRLKPGSRQKTIMLQNCGKKCFLGAKKSFPICNKNTCKTNISGGQTCKYENQKVCGGKVVETSLLNEACW